LTNTATRIRDWRIPVDLEVASFNMHETTIKPPESPQNNIENSMPVQETIKPNQQHSTQNTAPAFNTGMIDKLLPLIGKLNSDGGGGLDISTMLDLLDKSGQGFGALGKLLPFISPLLQNGQLGNLFSPKKKSMEDTIDYKSINLDNN